MLWYKMKAKKMHFLRVSEKWAESDVVYYSEKGKELDAVYGWSTMIICENTITCGIIALGMNDINVRKPTFLLKSLWKYHKPKYSPNFLDISK